MEIWSKCDICGRDIPVGELCYGLKKGNCICKDCCTGFENCTFTLAPAPTLTPPNEKPPCYLPEKDNPYPLCEGRGMKACAHCCLWEDYDPEEDEGRVNRPLTLKQLREMDGEPVYLMPMKWWALVESQKGLKRVILRLSSGGGVALYSDEGLKYYAEAIYRRPPEGEA